MKKTTRTLLGVVGLAATLAIAGCNGNGDSMSSGMNATFSETVPVNTVVGSNVAEVGREAPNFTLMDLDGDRHTLSSYTDAGKTVVLVWHNPQCPFVVKHYSNEDRQTFNMLADKYGDDDVAFLAINSGAPGKQGAGMDLNKQYRDDWNIGFPVLIDESGVVGSAYNAKRTPEIFIVDPSGTIRYHGAIDNNSSPSAIGDVNYVEQAIEDLMNGRNVRTPRTTPYGCTVKYGA